MSQTNNFTDVETEGNAYFKKAANEAGKVVRKKATKAASSKLAKSLIGHPVVIGIAIAVFALFLGGIVAAFIVLSSLSSVGEQQAREGYYGGKISDFGLNEIPSQYIPIYKAAQEKYGVPWNLLAAEHRVETRFSTLKNMVSPVGAVGGLQFMPLTWIGWSYPGGNSLGNAFIPNKILTDPAMIKKYGGYGVDANGDGKADPWDIEDAIYSAANYLAKNGAAEGRLRDAVYAYNHADWYVEEVLGFADRYVKGYVAVNPNVGGSQGSTGVAVVDVGDKWIGNSAYVFGGGRNQSDIASGRFDCSSFVHWAFAQVGVNLGPLGSTSTDTLKYLGKSVSPNEMKPGDLVFFDTYKPDGHVGIYIGNGKFIGAQTSKGVAIENMTSGYWKEKFNGRVQRI